MAEFGHTAEGTVDEQYYSSYISGQLETLSEAGTVSSMSCFCRLDQGTHIRYAIYDASLNFVAETAEAHVAAGNTWVSADFSSPPALAAGDYWLCFQVDGRTLFPVNNTGSEMKYDASTYPTWPAAIPGGAWDGNINRILSIKATYTAGGGAIGPSGAIVSAEDVDGAAMMRGTIQSEV